MATAIVVFHHAGNKSLDAASMPVARLPDARTQVLTTSGVSVQTTLNADGWTGKRRDGGFATVFAGSANLWVTSGSNPVASKPATGGEAGEGFPVYANQHATFAVDNDDEIALIEWA
jgi:hypothetical protein